MTRKNGEYLICPTCKTTFYAQRNKILKGWDKFCSQKCRKRPDLIQRNKTMDYSKVIQPRRFQKGQIPWNKDKKGCFSEDVIEKIRNARMKQKLPTVDTGIEVAMKTALDAVGILYEHPYVLHGKFVLDFAIPDLKVGIECDGDYWHSLPRNMSYDERKNNYCKIVGWRLLRFTEKEINTNISLCIEKVKQEVVLCV